MGQSVVIVESPAKAKTINKYLGKDYTVLASYGHVRDLPPKEGSVLPDEDFSMSWAVDSKSKSRLNDIAKAVKTADRLILATDPDREGEAISWHVLQVLSEKNLLKDKDVQRVVFNAITKQSVLDAMAHPREIDGDLVDAYLARRALDYLVGFSLSPVLWRKLPGARSAGRVQSVALRLICDREAEIEAFKPQEYWSITAMLKNGAGAAFEARIAEFDGQKLQRLDITTQEQAETIKALLEAADLSVSRVESKPTKRNPYAPFTTSTLQQDASRRLGFSASRTMQVAQKLYEGIDIGGETVGLITYMRTDGVQIAPEAVPQVRSQIEAQFGARYVPEKPRHYSTKAKNAQEAHEAIRPTDVSRTPKDMKSYLSEEQMKLYELVWRRTVASQMASAEIERTSVDITAASGGKKAVLRATGSVVRFDGFLAAYETQPSGEDEEDAKRLPALAEGEAVLREAIEAKQHFTEPPPRYSEASLIRKMEELGIGRPSTYTSVLSTLQNRDYVTLEKRRFTPASKGRVVTSFLESFFKRYVEYDFTADLEEKLDKISAGELAWKDLLHDFWKQFSASIEDIKDLRVSQVLDMLNEELAYLAFPPKEDGSNPRACPKCGEGQLSLKVGRFGAFIGCSNYPECNFTRQLGAGEDADAEDSGPKVLGRDPQTDEEITVRTGRFGPYVQRGEGKEAVRGSIPKGWNPAEIDYERAMQLLSLPQEVGKHPETGKMISAGIGRYGPFVLHEGVYANLDSPEEVFTVGLNRAVDLIAEKAAKGGRRGAAKSLKDLGEHPELGGMIAVKDGRYGPYVNHGKVNATLPKDKDPQSVTLEEAVALIAAKAGAKGKAKTRKKATARAGKG
ncbi:type I DNA topoisomerase [Salaquimonas pukyongi]|uniref:type I DNA topoisomerase n=1 Tax=Salaquimonas pukyongi TaxID=2712698 RepID=UPI00096BC273|nr:type I DNA topoisomerase [Salaquimonas pukyongi]